MPEPTFTIVIPTRERADTLYWALKTCIQQEYSNLEIIVSDNFSQDDTKAVVEAFNDPRIRYINTGHRVSMSRNWEFGLRHATGDYVSILGDDDGFLPGAVSAISEILQRHPGIAAISWEVSVYRWPNYILQEDANRLFVNTKTGYAIKSAYDSLKDVIFSGQPHTTLPWLYAGFVKREILNHIANKSAGTFFHSQQPDIYSAIVISCSIDEYIRSSAPYSIAGSSKSSGGISYFHPYKNTTAGKAFQEEDNIPFHRSLVIFPSIYIMIYESVVQAYEIGLLPRELKPELLNSLKIAYEGINPINREIALDALRKIGDLNGIDPDFFARLEVPPRAQSWSIGKKVLAVIRENHIVKFDGDNFSLYNIYDAAVKHDLLARRRQPYALRLARTLCIKTYAFLLRRAQAVVPSSAPTN